MDPDPAFFDIDLQDAIKKIIFVQKISAYYFLKVHLLNFSKEKGEKGQKIVGIKFSLLFLYAD